MIRSMIDKGYYVCFGGVDDYYVKGKSWYKKRHFAHEGCICGYNQIDKTYCIYAYDEKWIYRKFWTPQKDFEKGRQAIMKKESYGGLCALKANNDMVEIDAEKIMQNLHKYLNSDLDIYSPSDKGDVYGIAVHDYICFYLQKLYDTSIPYEKTDSRIFRLIWEHKKVMHMRIKVLEDDFGFDNSISSEYYQIVSQADKLRILYASHCLKPRFELLPVICEELISLKNAEYELLKNLISKAEKRL